MIIQVRMKKMNRFKTYLAGAFAPYKKYSDWREYVLKEIKNTKIEFYDSRTASGQLCPATFTIDDANGVIDSNIIFHYRMRGCEDDGTSWEHGIGFACNLLLQRNPNIKIKKTMCDKHLFLGCMKKLLWFFLHRKLHKTIFLCSEIKTISDIIKPKLIIYANETAVPFPLHFGSANITFNDLETAVEFLDSLKSLNKMDFMKDYLRLLDRERAGGEK